MSTPITSSGNTTSGTSGTAGTTGTAATPKADALANKEVFLQLLVAQIKNQNPMNPADSMQYITQLSQFTGVEQLVEIKNSMKSLNDKFTAATSTTTSGSQSNGN